MKEIKSYILLVDSYRRPSRQRNTAGRYRVGAKSEKEAIKLLRDKIKFGSIQIYTIDHTHKTPYKTIIQEYSFLNLKRNSDGVVVHEFKTKEKQPRCATDPIRGDI